MASTNHALDCMVAFRNKLQSYEPPLAPGVKSYEKIDRASKREKKKLKKNSTVSLLCKVQATMMKQMTISLRRRNASRKEAKAEAKAKEEKERRRRRNRRERSRKGRKRTEEDGDSDDWI